MKYIEHLIEPDRLLLSWQAQDSKDRSRYVVGELVRSNGTITLNYFKDSKDFREACKHGFDGHPAFRLRDNIDTYSDQVLEAFTRRIPPRNRSDFYRYLELRGLNPKIEISDFTLLGYVGARLPDDGFELVHPFDTAKGPFELVTEVAGFRHESEVSAGDIAPGSTVHFTPEPNNRYDPDAIRIEWNGKKLGYVDRGRLELFHRHLAQGHTLSGEVCRKNGTPDRPLVYIYTQVIPVLH